MQTPSTWNDVPVLVTGGAGFVGAHLVHALLEQGARVTILDIKPIPQIKGHYDAVAGRAKYVQGSVSDQTLVDELVRTEKFEAVFHLAAEAIVARFHQNPTVGLDTNIRGTWTILDAVRRYTPEASVVIASSDKAYGSHETLPYDESSPLQGRNPYDCSKSCTDLIAHMYAHSYGLKLTVTRCGNVYGGGDLNFSRIIPDAIRLTLQGKPFVFRSDGQFLRDYVHVNDVVAAYISCANALRSGQPSGEAYNFSHNAPISAMDVVRKILALENAAHLEPVVDFSAQYEIRDQFLDSRKAMERLGWAPTVAFDDGLKGAIDWYRMLLAEHPDYARDR
jgi:CDP-glucose 4,6-dehydratase